jgi:integrase
MWTAHGKHLFFALNGLVGCVHVGMDSPASPGCRLIARSAAIATMEVGNANSSNRTGLGQEVRLHEKGGKRHEMPAHHNLEAYLDAYVEAAGIRDDGKSPLFRSTSGRTGELTLKAMNRIDAWRMIQRRAGGLGMKVKIGCHTFRATGITAYLEAGGTLENAQAMAAHESPRTTKLYDRTGDEITLDEVERISI